MIFRIILYAFLAYVLYKIIFDLVIPVHRTTKQFKKGFQEMSARMNRSDGHNHMNDHMDQQQKTSSESNTSPSSQKPAGDYIDFEEVK